MARKIINRVKLGVFVLAGLGFLILLLYIIGKNQNMFGSTFILKARFDNVHGLMPGNNIRFAGIDAGTVRSIKVLNDTTIEVSMLVKNKMKGYIRKNATVSISTDGLMGNRLLNIEAAKRPAALVDEGDILLTTQGPDTDEMLNVLNSTVTYIPELSYGQFYILSHQCIRQQLAYAALACFQICCQHIQLRHGMPEISRGFADAIQ